MKFNIIKFLYKYSPMNFYLRSEGTTIIKSVIGLSNKSYKFEKLLTDSELDNIWGKVKNYKRASLFCIFLSFIAFLYLILCPNYSLFFKYSLSLKLAGIFAILVTICFVFSEIFSYCFKRFLKKNYGQYSTVLFNDRLCEDKKYYNLYKLELVKVAIALIILLCLCQISPSNIAKENILNKQYYKALKTINIAIKLIPINPELYAMSGYTNFKLGNYNKALADYKKAYALSEEETKLMNFDNIIYIKFHTHQYKSALKDFDKEISSSKTNEDKDQLLWDKAQFLYNIGKYKQALAIYNILIEKAEEDRVYLLKDRLYLERSQIYDKLGNTEAKNADIAESGITDYSDEVIPVPVLLFNGEEF